MNKPSYSEQTSQTLTLEEQIQAALATTKPTAAPHSGTARLQVADLATEINKRTGLQLSTISTALLAAQAAIEDEQIEDTDTKTPRLSFAQRTAKLLTN